MRKFYLLTTLILSSVFTWSQTRNWIGGSGDWNNETNWSPIGLPSASDTVQFTGISATISNVPTISLAGMIITESDIIFHGFPGSANMVSIGDNGLPGEIIIESSASLTIGNNLHMSLSGGSTATIKGLLAIQTGRRFVTNQNGSKAVVTGILRNNGGEIFSGKESLQFDDGGTYQHAMDQGTIPQAAWDKNSTCLIEGIISRPPEGLNQEFGNYVWDARSQTSISVQERYIPSVIKGDLEIRNTFSSTGQALYLPLPDSIRVVGRFMLQNGNVFVNGYHSGIHLSGDFDFNNGHIKALGTLGNGSIAIHFAGISRQAISITGGQIERGTSVFGQNEIRFNVNNQAAVDFGLSVLRGDAGFFLNKGGKLITAHPQGISSDEAKGSVQVGGMRFFSSEAEYEYNGKSAQVTGNGLPLVVSRLIIHNSSGLQTYNGVSLSSPLAISKELVLTKGFLQTTAENMLTIQEGAGATAIENSFVAGPMQKAGSTAFTFPTGWAGAEGGLIPIGISSLSMPAIVQAEYRRAPATQKGNTIKAPLHHISYCEYWELFPVSGNPNAIVTMYRNAHSNCNPFSIVLDFSTIRVARSDGSAWAEAGNEDGTMVLGNGYVVSDSSGLLLSAGQKYFTIGNISSAKDPLPVMFDNVMAYEKSKGVTVEWSNLTERDMAIYFVERSVNGKDFSIISQHLAKNNRDEKASYAYFDSDPAQGTNYYRIKAIEKSTKIIFSRVMRIDTEIPEQKMGIYPNPVKDRQVLLSLSGLKEGKCQATVHSATGQYIMQKNFIIPGSFSTLSLELPYHIKPGIYNVVIANNGYRFSKVFIVQ